MYYYQDTQGTNVPWERNKKHSPISHTKNWKSLKKESLVWCNFSRRLLWYNFLRLANSVSLWFSCFRLKNKSFQNGIWVWVLKLWNSDNDKQLYCQEIQPWPLAIKRLLNNPYVNGVKLTKQNPLLKCRQHLETCHTLKQGLDLLMLKFLSM